MRFHALALALVLANVVTPCGGQSHAPTSLCAQLSGGVYLTPPNGDCFHCPAGHGCPAGISITQTTLHLHRCPVGTYQPLQGQASCLTCPRDAMCPGEGLESFTPCGDADSAEPGSTACDFCTHQRYYIDGTSCVVRTQCVEGEQYAASMSRFADTVCAPLQPYTPTPVSPTPSCVVGGARLCHGVLAEYIEIPETPTSDRVLWAWEPCPAGHYLHAPLVAEKSGLLVRRQECRPYTDCAALGMYVVVDGTRSEDQDNVCATPRVCLVGKEYRVAEHRPAGPENGYVGSDTVCAPYTRCDPRSEYLAVRGNETSDNACAPVEVGPPHTHPALMNARRA